jgi:hypothetical protein
VILGLLLGLLFAAGGSVLLTAATGLASSSVGWLILIAACLAYGFVAAVAFTSLWRRYLALLLATRRRMPWRLGRFLDWATDAGLLRMAGAAYQFRHRELQEQLAHHGGPATARQARAVAAPGPIRKLIPVLAFAVAVTVAVAASSEAITALRLRTSLADFGRRHSSRAGPDPVRQHHQVQQPEQRDLLPGNQHRTGLAHLAAPLPRPAAPAIMIMG